MLKKISSFLWGDLSRDEFKKFGILTATFFFIIGSYWTLRPLKDTCFMKIVGKVYLPYAQLLSLCFFFLLVMVYAKLVDIFEKDKLFYIICGVFIIVFLFFAFALKHPVVGLSNVQADPFRLLGWMIYVAVDSFGVLVTSLFWSFVASTTETVSAKKGYALILGGSQLGSIIGPTLNTKASLIGVPQLIFIACIGIACILVMIKIFMSYGYGHLMKNEQTQGSTGILEGLRLLLSRPYLVGVFVVASFYEIITAIVEYQMLFMAESVYKTPEKIAEFLGFVGQGVILLPLIVGLLGVSLIVRKLGVTFGLVFVPLISIFLIFNVILHPGLLSISLALICIKGLSYSLNNTCKEILYIPTSKDIKFKAKSWIDGFGNRSLKGIGAGINALVGHWAVFMFLGAMISLGVIAIWLPVAFWVGRKNHKLVVENKIIE